MPGQEISIVVVNGKQFVSGLMWEPLKRPRAYMSEAREIGKREGMDIVAIRLGVSMIQAGFVKKGNGVTKGMYSLASALSGQIAEESWIGAFELSNGQYALVAVHKGLIVPGCDIVSDRQTVYDLLLEKDSQRRVMDFSKVFHPVDFGYRGSPRAIEEILEPKAMRKEYALKPLKFGLTTREMLQIGAVTLTVIVGIVAYQQWLVHRAEEARQAAAREEAQRQADLAALNARAGEKQPLQALEHPWAKQPGVEDFLNACQGAIDALPLAMGGWVFKSATCSADAIESVYSREGNRTFNDFKASTRGLYSAAPVLLGEGNEAALGDLISIGAGGDDELLDFIDLQAEFLSHLQSAGITAVLNEIPVMPPAQPSLPGADNAPSPPPPDWRQHRFSVSSPLTPTAIFYKHHLPGVRLVQIKAVRQQAQLTWTIEGDLYAR